MPALKSPRAHSARAFPEMRASPCPSSCTAGGIAAKRFQISRFSRPYSRPLAIKNVWFMLRRAQRYNVPHSRQHVTSERTREYVHTYIHGEYFWREESRVIWNIKHRNAPVWEYKNSRRRGTRKEEGRRREDCPERRGSRIIPAKPRRLRRRRQSGWLVCGKKEDEERPVCLSRTHGLSVDGQPARSKFTVTALVFHLAATAPFYSSFSSSFPSVGGKVFVLRCACCPEDPREPTTAAHRPAKFLKKSKSPRDYRMH